MTPKHEGLSPVENLDATHNVDSFDCGKEPFDRLLKRFALAPTDVVSRGLPVLAYYSLAAGAVERPYTNSQHTGTSLWISKKLPAL